MTKILLVRHGETDWNRDRRVLGWNSISLNANGATQTKTLADFLPPFKIERIYSSPLPRALETARIIASTLNLTPIEEPRFIEANIGSWEGRLWNELENDPARLQYYTSPLTARPPNGEISLEVHKRAAEGFDALCNQHPEGTLLIVTHADLIRFILCHCLRIDIKIVRQFLIHHASISLISSDQGNGTLHCLNFIPDRSASEMFLGSGTGRMASL